MSQLTKLHSKRMALSMFFSGAIMAVPLSVILGLTFPVMGADASSNAISMIGIETITSAGTPPEKAVNPSRRLIQFRPSNPCPAKDSVDYTGQGRWVRNEAYNMMLSGAHSASAQLMLDYLRSLSENDPYQIEEVHSTCQLLGYELAGLMPEAELIDFLNNTLSPEQYPVDAVADYYFYQSLEKYLPLRPGRSYSLEVVWDKLVALGESPSPLVRACGFMHTATAYEWMDVTDEVVESILLATNELGELIPDNRLFGEVLREHLRQCVGAGFAATPEIKELFKYSGLNASEGAPTAMDSLTGVMLLLDNFPWSDAVKKAYKKDPVVGLLNMITREALKVEQRGGSAEDIRNICIDMLVAASTENSDIRVRDWTLRAMVQTPFMLMDYTAPPETREKIKNSWTEKKRNISISKSLQFGTDTTVSVLAKSAENSTGTTTVSEEVTVDTARAHYYDFLDSLHEGLHTEIEQLINTLVAQGEIEAPIDINYYEAVMQHISLYAYSLADEERYDDAVTLFEGLAASYPGSILSERWTSSAEFLRQVIAGFQE